MFARGGFLYKRSGAHPNLAARVSPTLPSVGVATAPSPSPSTAADTKSTDPISVLTSVVVPAPQTTATPVTSPSPSTSSSPTPAASSTSSQSSPSSASSSSSKASTPSSSSSLGLSVSAIVSTPSTLASTPTTHAASVSTQLVTGTLFTPTSSLSPSTTSSTGSSSTTNTGAIVGGVAGTLAGIAALGFLLMWCMRRQRSRDVDDDFDAQAFKRQSAVLLDDPVEPPRSYNPRPPTMIERHNASPALAAQGGYGQNFYGGYGGYDQQPHAPSEIHPAGSPPPQAYGAPPMGYASYNDPQQHVAMQNVGYSGYDSQHQLARQPSNAAYLTRLPSSAAGYVPPTAPPGSIDPNAHYIDLNRSSISPYQAAQYADISRQLGTTDPNGQASRAPSELPDDPLPSPFDDPVEAAPVPNVAYPRTHLGQSSDAAAPGPVSVIPAPQIQGNAPQRPATIYEEGDAYGGI